MTFNHRFPTIDTAKHLLKYKEGNLEGLEDREEDIEQNTKRTFFRSHKDRKWL